MHELAYAAGLKPEEFYNITWADYSLVVRGYYLNFDIQWSRMRVIPTLIYNTNQKKGKQITSEKFMPLGIDKLNMKPPMTKEEFESAVKRLAKYGSRSEN